MNVKRRFLNKVSLPITTRTGDMVYWSNSLGRWVVLPAVKYGSFLMSRGIGNPPVWVNMSDYNCFYNIEVTGIEWGDVVDKEKLLPLEPIDLDLSFGDKGDIKEKERNIGLHLSYNIT